MSSSSFYQQGAAYSNTNFIDMHLILEWIPKQQCYFVEGYPFDNRAHSHRNGY